MCCTEHKRQNFILANLLAYCKISLQSVYLVLEHKVEL